ncbi:putative uv radiation resistance protein [Botrytis fragariae]|uniref:Autophagy-related protein 14 n=1 Tax=Botrytis fragariae TaxID=1964551 RepID=A0A8H6AJR6_9HELO|nr:putative uv radiation resistance protein [Botrytis fragariae]KAF5868528.1 putative uv radiation resistance protein [Botrytis fragariae]
MSSEASRPLILPQNRKLRHLQGIYVRNLTLSRPRGKTIDDAGLNKSPQKLEALRRESQLHHAQSSGDLRPSARTRRSSSNWVGASPSIRQKKLEDVRDSRMADSFFTLHCEGQDDPIYISEVVEKAMNPTFRSFDLSPFGPATTRLDTVIVKIWVKRQDFVPLIEEEVNLQSLQFLGRLENHPFPPNSIIFQLVDGIYTIDLTSKPPRPRPSIALPTSSYNALMRLSNLDESIQDALATREQLTSQINNILTNNTSPSTYIPVAKESLALAKRYVTTSRKLLHQSQARQHDLKASISSRRAAISSGYAVQSAAETDVQNAQEHLNNSRTLLTNTKSLIRDHRRRLCEELIEIYPIEPTSHPLLFTICGLPLPNTTDDDNISSADEDVVAAALGYVAQLVNHLQYYLGVPLPYPITPHASRSLIHDPISLVQDRQRIFPLYPQSVIRFRFDWGVFLLNKNIEALAESQGLRVLDIRQTVPNLKYLLYVCSAGSEELPERKRGGVKGLLIGGAGTIRGGSRRGSEDSAVATGVGDAVRKALEHGNGGVGLGSGLENGAGNGNAQAAHNGQIQKEPLVMAGRSLRTSGLRENVH